MLIEIDAVSLERELASGELKDIVLFDEQMITKIFGTIVKSKQGGYVVAFEHNGGPIFIEMVSDIEATDRGQIFLCKDDPLGRVHYELPTRMQIDHEIRVDVCWEGLEERPKGGISMADTRGVLESMGLTCHQYAGDYVEKHRSFFELDNIRLYEDHKNGLISKDELITVISERYKLWELVVINE